ncbi:hypothetical protein, partial [Rathayibacter iranicus]
SADAGAPAAEEHPLARAGLDGRMSADAGRLLTRDEILSLLEEVADRLDARGVGVDVPADVVRAAAFLPG